MKQINNFRWYVIIPVNKMIEKACTVREKFI